MWLLSIIFYLNNSEKCLIMKPKNNQILVIGYGNSLRCDDGVGQLVAIEVEKLNLYQVRSIYLHQLTPELAEKIAEFENIIFIDASIESEQLKLTKLKYSQVNNNWTHHLTPESLIYLTEFLYQKTPQAWLITIPIKKINFGEKISNFAEEGKQEALEIIKNMIENLLVKE